MGSYAAKVDPLKLFERVLDPDDVANTGFVYTKEVGGQTELFYDDPDQAPIQITSGSGLAVPAHPDPVRLSDGSAAAPSYSFTASSGAGMFLDSGAGGDLGFASLGVERYRITRTGLHGWGMSGITPTLPYEWREAGKNTLSMTSGLNAVGEIVELFFRGGDSAGAVQTYGAISADIVSNALGDFDGRIRFEVASNGSLVEIFRIDEVALDLTAGTAQLRANSGSVGAPGVSVGAADTGFYYVAAANQQLSVSVDGRRIAHFFDIDGGEAVLQLENAGDAANPVIRLNFAGLELNTGLFAPGADIFAVSAGGTERQRWTTTGTRINGDLTFLGSGDQILMPDGDLGAPAYAFSLANNTGMYYDSLGSPDLYLVVGGAQLLALKSSGGNRVTVIGDLFVGSGGVGDITMQKTGGGTVFGGTQISDTLTLDSTTSGTKGGITIGGSSELIGLYGVTAVAQHSTTGQTAGFTAGVGTAVNDDSTFTGGVGATAYTIGDVVRALKNIGAMAA